MPAVFISSEFLASFKAPPAALEAAYFVVAHSEAMGRDHEQTGWIEDRTRVTNDPAVAILWALVLSGVADDGSNLRPLARVKSFDVNPLDDPAEDEDGNVAGERVAIYVTESGDILSIEDDEFGAIDAEVADWSEIVKEMGTDDEDPASDLAPSEVETA